MIEISPQARAFIEAPPERMAYSLDPDGVVAWRAAIRAASVDWVESEVARLGVTTHEIEIGGVPCMEVLPPGDVNGSILYCFGGGYVSGSAFEDLPISAALAVHCGLRVIAPHYRLAPEHPFPAPVDDAVAVAVAMGGPFALVGESAGGNLALAVALRLRETGADMPSAMALMSPWCDLTHSGESLTANDGRDPMLPLDDVKRAAVVYAGEYDVADPRLSPLLARYDAPFPPVILTSGTRDLLLSSTVQMAAALRAAGGIVDLRVWEDMWHVFEFYDVPEGRASLEEIGQFLRHHGDFSSAPRP